MPSESPARPVRWGLIGVLAVLGFHFSSFDIGTQPIVTDVRYFLYYAWQVSEGAVPHVDFFENKPQLSVFVSAGLFSLADATGLDPLLAIRAGQLALAGLAAFLAFIVFSRLGGAVCGWVGLAGALAFGLLGVLPSVGTLPKLLMVVLGPAAALLAHDRRWGWAGLVGGLAFFDWQVGAAAWLAVAVAALADRGQRGRALGRVCRGGFLAVLPLAIYYGIHGALGATFEQVVLATLSRGASSLEAQDLAARASRALALIRVACPEQMGWLMASMAGVPVALWLLSAGRRRPGGEDRARLVLPLCVFYGAIVAMSAIEVQGYGDLFALLHAAAFGLGLLGWAALSAVRRWVSPPWAPAAFAALALLAARPGLLRPAVVLQSPAIAPGAALSDQREVARSALRTIGEAPLAAFDASELLFLMRRRNAVPTLYWNRAARAHFRAASDASPTDTVIRLLDASGAEFFIPPRRLGDRGRLLRGSRPIALRSQQRRYAVELRER